jgi:hypothetical protein
LALRILDKIGYTVEIWRYLLALLYRLIHHPRHANSFLPGFSMISSSTQTLEDSNFITMLKKDVETAANSRLSEYKE